MYCKFTNTTSVSPQHITITGLAGGGTLDLVCDAESDLGTPIMIAFPSPLAASAQNTAITMTIPSPGGTIVISAWLTGYQQ
jgi:poly(3-hydroxybutyrate) depolymerase